VVPIVFKGLSPQQVEASIDCPFDPADPAELPGAKAVFLHKPTGSDLEKYTPARAADQKISGATVVECQAIQNKFKNCRTVREDPRGFGFGAAAIRLATVFQLRPLDQENQPVEGRRFRFSMSFWAR
jgi:hypothetical protein